MGKKRTLCSIWNGKTFVIMIMVVFIMIGIYCTKLYDDKNMQIMQDIYFLEYENGIGNTIIYKYNVQNDVTEKIGQIYGFFDYCKINRDEKYIIGILTKYTEGKREDSIVKYYLEDMRCEECISADEIRRIDEGKLIRSEIEVCDGGKSILLRYYHETGIVCILYDLETGNYQYEETEKEEKFDIEGVLTYDIYPSGNEEKYAFFKTNRTNKLYLYDVRSGTSQCIISTGWNTNLSPSIGWDESGEYLFYFKNFQTIIWNHADVSVMVYDLNTKKSYRIFKVKNTDHIFSFIENM